MNDFVGLFDPALEDDHARGNSQEGNSASRKQKKKLNALNNNKNEESGSDSNYLLNNVTHKEEATRRKKVPIHKLDNRIKWKTPSHAVGVEMKSVKKIDNTNFKEINQTQDFKKKNINTTECTNNPMPKTNFSLLNKNLNVLEIESLNDKKSVGSINFNSMESVDVISILENKSLPDQLPSEPQEGNIEYKLKLLNPNQERLKRLVSQMQWRLREGLGEAIYEIGVEDSGLLLGLTDEELEMSLSTLRSMAKQLGASLTLLREIKTVEGKKVAEVLVWKVPDDQYSIELRIAVLGSSDVGKSTLLGVLTRGELDNGRGCARLNVFRHRHEVYSGKTSSVSIQTMGFDANGNVVDGTCSRSRDYDDVDICSQSCKIVNFIDLAGDQRYLHTTAFGLSGYFPHYAMLVVNAFSGLSPMSSEHLSLARALDLQLILIITKTDLASPEQLENTVSSLTSVLTAPPHKKLPYVVKSTGDAITSGRECNSRVVPIFFVSNVTGDGLEILKKFLRVLPPKMTTKDRDRNEHQVAQFQIDEVFHVDDRVVVGGLLTSGVLPIGANLLLGPTDNCTFSKVSVESIHRNKVPCKVVCAGQSSSLSLRGQSKELQSIRKGMKLLDEEAKPKAVYFFQARIKIRGSSDIGKGSQLTSHIGNVRQTVVIEGVFMKEKVRETDTEPSCVLLRFLRQPEYITEGSRLLLRQANITGEGMIEHVFEEPPNTLIRSRT